MTLRTHPPHTLYDDMRIGVQVLVEGEKVEIQRLLELLTLFLECLLPTMIALQQIGIIGLIFKGGLSDAWTGLINPIRILYYALLLGNVLFGVMKNELKMGTGTYQPG